MEKEKPKVWVIGLGRTGTNSICEALRILGYKNVIHNPTFEELNFCDAAADNGCIIFYKYLDKKYPGSKFILATRDLKSWLKSIECINKKNPADNDIKIMRRMFIYETTDFDREKMISAYKRHHKDVKRYFKNRKKDLLIMNVINGDSWDKLCSFLELPKPIVQFPFLNMRKK